MAGTILGMLLDVFGAVVEWFSVVMDKTQVGHIWVACVTIWMTYKFLLSRIFGDAGSDTVTKSRKDAGD